MEKKKRPTAPDPKTMSFEQAAEEVEQLIEQIEEGEIGLQKALEARRRGDALIRHCRSILDVAEQELEQMTAEEAEGDES